MSGQQASFLTKRVNLNGKRVNLAIWDTAGQERFHALGPIYYRESHGAILVYDITDQDSFLKVKNWVRELRRMLGDDICLVIGGNKTDLERERRVSLEEAETYAREVGALHFLTSAKLNQGVEELFLELTRRMLQTALTNDQQRINSLTRGGSTTARNLQIVDDQEAPSSGKSSCCSS
ncbi:Ras-related protein Rab-21 [Chionoecetes opilio]|uniref:Ras-related protein Rab-21 n=1 Tax=Chionoecetes opilio TaxID=41210 RepID=A0A8J4Y0B1_CHIOP|nr:Ras-related protein Rab-21 [Chionoecetes opilio]